jgi:hypothetical protein
MHVLETYRDGPDELVYEFTMRCWTAAELRAAAAAFPVLEVRAGAEAGIAPDRLQLVARLG